MTLRVGLLGTGHWAAEVHAAALTAADGVDLVGIWGRSPGKAEALAGRYDVDAAHDLDALLADVDAVAIAVPPDVQADLAVRAASAGCHLVLEKPLALSRAAADRVVEAVDAAGVASVVFFTNRFAPPIAGWLDEVAAQGEWHGAHAWWFGAIDEPGNPFGDSPWRRAKGALWDVGPHALSVTLPVLGPVTDVSAAEGRGDTVHLVCQHRSGASSVLSLSLTVPGAAAGAALEVHGTPGRSAMPPAGTEAVDAYGAALDQLRGELAAGRRTGPCDVRFGRQVVAVLEAAEAILDLPRAQRSAPVAWPAT